MHGIALEGCWPSASCKSPGQACMCPFLPSACMHMGGYCTDRLLHSVGSGSSGVAQLTHACIVTTLPPQTYAVLIRSSVAYRIGSGSGLKAVLQYLIPWTGSDNINRWIGVDLR